MTSRAIAVVALLCTAGASVATAQDSSRADWRAWFAARDSAARCRALPLIWRSFGPQGDVYIHRTPTGGTCRVGPGPMDPAVLVIDSAVFCPDSSPSTWGHPPPGVRAPDAERILDVQMSRDSALLTSFKCPLRPWAAVIVRSKRSR